MHFNPKKFFLVVFFLLLLGGIPAAVYMLQQQQITQQQAEKSTNFSFNPASTESSPITVNLGDNVPLDVMVDPGSNIVSSVTIEVTYDPAKLEAANGSLVVNSTVFPTILTAPIYTSGKIVAVLGVGSPNQAIQTKSKAATVTFKTLAGTQGTPTKVTYTDANIATSRGPNDQALENVFLLGQPAYIAINSTEEPSATPTNTPTPGPNNDSPVCTALTANQTSGAAPFGINFTATGTDSDGTISKATFNFGDGQVSDVTSGGGIGSDSASIQIAHTYTSAGTFQATAILTDNNNGISSNANCSQSISVSGGTVQATATPTPTIVPSGSTEVLFGIGAASLLLIIGGGLLFLIL